MPPELAIFDAYVPTILLLVLAGVALTWLLDRVLAKSSLYRLVWHPALFRMSMLVTVCGLLALTCY